ncbi:MAG: hypothetical protein LBF34_02500 [Puniceicoccales bacterium]|jgi:hypothetical protein|nr:hypothetical protein [Puniceicoccales bacterium]
MSAVGGSHRNIRKELEEFRSGIKKLNDTSKLSGTINGQTYNAEIAKSRWLKIPEVIVKDKRGKEIMRCKIKNFDESKLKHEILKHQWKAKKNFSIEQRVQLYAVADGHKVGKSGKSNKQIELEEIKKECLEVVKNKKAPINERANALFGLNAIYQNWSPKEKQSGEEVAKILTGFNDSTCVAVAEGLLDAIGDSNLSKEKRDESMQLLVKIYNNLGIPKNIKKAIDAKMDENIVNNKLSDLDYVSLCSQCGRLKGNEELIRVASGSLLDTIKNPELPKEDREKAGGLLAKIYSYPETPKDVKKIIISQVREIAQSMVCDMTRINSGVPREVMDQVIGGWGLPDGVIPQVKDPVANKVLWPRMPLLQYGTMNPDTQQANAKGITLNEDGIIMNSTEECLKAQYPGCEIQSKLVECDGNQHPVFLVKDPTQPNSLPIVVMDFSLLGMDSLASLSENLRSGSTDAKDSLRIKFGVKEDDLEGAKKMEKFTRQQRPIETKDELLSAINTVCSEYETTLKEASDSFDLLIQMGIAQMVGVFSEDSVQNQGFSMNLTSTQGAVGLMDSKKNAQKALREAISNAVKKGYIQDMLPQEQAIIVRAAKIVTGKDMTFEEAVA